MRLLTFLFFAASCYGQEKDLVYGGLKPEELVSAIKFWNPKARGGFIKIDNMGNGDPFSMLLTYETVEKVYSIRSEDTIKISRASFDCVYEILSADSAWLKRKFTTICGTFRIVLYNGADACPKVYYADGYHFSKKYFDALSVKAEECGSELMLRKFRDIGRAFRLGIISECR